MAEDHVSRDQHRADMAELRGELKEEIAGIRQDIAVLVKVVEVQGQRMEQGFADLRREMMQMQTGMDRQFAELRLDIRELRTTSQRQMWTLIGVTLLTLVGGAVKLAFF